VNVPDLASGVNQGWESLISHTYLGKDAIEAVPYWERQNSLPALVRSIGNRFLMHFALCHVMIGHIVEHPTDSTNFRARKNIFEGTQSFQRVTLMAVSDGTRYPGLVDYP
jgi:hypothetical protein